MWHRKNLAHASFSIIYQKKYLCRLAVWINYSLNALLQGLQCSQNHFLVSFIVIMSKIKRQNLYFSLSKLHCSSGAESWQHEMAISLLLLLGAANHLALAVLKEINLCWQHPVGVKCWNPVLDSNLKYQKRLFFICTWEKFLYKVLQHVFKLCGSRGAWSHLPHWDNCMACTHASAPTRSAHLSLLHLEFRMNSIRKA